MKKVLPFVLITIIIVIVGWFVFLLTQVNLQLLNPKGIIANQQTVLIAVSMGIMLSIAIPVVITAYFIGWKYRAGNKKSHHSPDLVGSKSVLSIYIFFFVGLVLIFFFIVWKSAHELDPHRPIIASEDPITVQVVSLQWKWLFIYPDEGIATVNFLQVPVDTPINFRLTSDGLMNSFWIPSLGGQIYSMASMETKIHLMADEVGDYRGEAAEINGVGFSGMRFTTRASTREDFDKWVEVVQSSSKPLTEGEYGQLAKPSKDVPVTYYSSVDSGLYNNIMMKYMTPSEESSHNEGGGH